MKNMILLCTVVWACMVTEQSAGFQQRCPSRDNWRQQQQIVIRPRTVPALIGKAKSYIGILQASSFGSEVTIPNATSSSAGSYDKDFVWIWEDGNGDEESGGTWRRPKNRSVFESETKQVTHQIRNWCENFVVQLDLCPWAKASVQTKGAMRFFLVPPITPAKTSFDDLPAVEGDAMEWQAELDRSTRIVHNIAGRFQKDILQNLITTDSHDRNQSSPSSSSLERAAIYFVIFLSSSSQNSFCSSFSDFNNWFMDLEDDWPEDLEEDVIIAPFHPEWEFSAGDDDDIMACLDYEKRSPYPLVSLVSTRVVEKAGEEVTNTIGEYNEEALLSIESEAMKTRDEKGSNRGISVAELWRTAVYGQK